MGIHYLLVVALLFIPATAAAQRGPRPDPLVREGVTVQLGGPLLCGPGRQRGGCSQRRDYRRRTRDPGD